MVNPNRQPDAPLDNRVEAQPEAADTATYVPPANPDAPRGAVAENTEHFIDQHVLHNDGLTPAAKEFMVNIARSQYGPWGVKDFVTQVEQMEGTIIINSKQGAMSFYYMPGLPHPVPQPPKRVVPEGQSSVHPGKRGMWRSKKGIRW